MDSVEQGTGAAQIAADELTVQPQVPTGYYGELNPTDEEFNEVRNTAHRRVKPPKGVKFYEWQQIVDAACVIARVGETITQQKIKNICTRIPQTTIDTVFESDKFARVLDMRGVVQDNSSVGMTSRQFMVLNLLSNFSDTRKINVKLKAAGVSPSEFQQWLSSSTKFKRLYRQMSEQLFDEAQASVNVALTQGAVDGDIRFIKYFNEVSGRFDPASRQVADIQEVLRTVTEIITSTVTDPDILREIGGRMAMLVGSSGMGGALNSTVQNTPELSSEPASFFS